MLKVGIVGIGFMGWIHYLAYRQLKNVEVVAICDRDPLKRKGDWRKIQGNFGPPGEIIDVSKIAVFDNFESMCEHELDLVDICLPPWMHCDSICLAAESGKHVFCEKPLSLSRSACEKAVNRCREFGRQLFVGHVLPYFPEFSKARKIIESKKHGELKSMNLKRIVSNPSWLPDFFEPGKDWRAAV